MGNAVCVPNIGAAQRHRRFWPGVVSLVVGVDLALLPGEPGYPALLHAVAAVLVFGGFTGVFQAREKT